VTGAAARHRPSDDEYASTPRSYDAAALMSIGEVLARLRADFPDVTISKLRFLEAEGLVEPHRSPSGYRKYTPEHLRRLRYVLTAQRERYLPLRVIREQLAAVDGGERVVGLSTAPPEPDSAESDSVGSDLVGSDSVGSDLAGSGSEPAARRSALPAGAAEVRLSRAELIERAGLTEAQLAELVQFGLLAPGPSGSFDGEALTVARVAARLSGYGLEARHLRPYRAAADREVGLLAQIVAPLARQSGPNRRGQAVETVHELAALCAELHAALVRAGLRHTVGH